MVDSQANIFIRPWVTLSRCTRAKKGDVKAAFDYFCPALPDESFAQLVQHGLDLIIPSTEAYLHMNGSTGTLSTITDMDENTSATMSPGDVDFSTKSANVETSVEGNVSVFWLEDEKFYPSTVHDA